MNILLIGPRGCGKTTIGRRVAERSGRRFVDLDDLVLGRFEEPTVSEVWAAHGEGAWRAAEVDALDDALSRENQVVALGGGVPMIEAGGRRIEAARRAGDARVVYLKCGVDELSRRLSAAPGDRPSLTGGDVVEEIGSVLRRREPTYEAMADAICDASDPDPRIVAEAVLRLVNAAPGQGADRPRSS